MNQKLNYRLMLPVGMALIVAGLLVSHFTKMPDSYQGGLMGCGIGIMIVALVKLWQSKRSEAEA